MSNLAETLDGMMIYGSNFEPDCSYIYINRRVRRAQTEKNKKALHKLAIAKVSRFFASVSQPPLVTNCKQLLILSTSGWPTVQIIRETQSAPNASDNLISVVKRKLSCRELWFCSCKCWIL